MRVGVVVAVAGMPLHRCLDLTTRAEDTGCDTVAAGEATYDSFAVAALMATSTKRARLMTTVTTWVRPPLATATGAVTVAELAEGRFALGLGSMPEAWNRDHYGINPSHAAARMREYVECVRGAAAASVECPFNYDGRFFQVRDYARTWPPVPPIPVHLAATRPRMAQLAGELADGVLFNVIHTMGWLHDVLEPAVIEGERRAGGRRTERGVMVRLVVHEPGGRDRALIQARAAVAPYLAVPYLAEVLGHHGWPPEAATGRALEELVLIGTVSELATRLESYRGIVDWVLLTPTRMLPPRDMDARYDAVFIELIPLLHAAA